MIRFLTFLFVIAGLAVYFYLSSRPQPPLDSAPGPKKKRAPKAAADEEFWIQVYDTDSSDEARRIQAKFHDLGIQCFLYEQGKKDVFGNVLKHFGISVPRRLSDRAQSILAQFTF